MQAVNQSLRELQDEVNQTSGSVARLNIQLSRLGRGKFTPKLELDTSKFDSDLRSVNTRLDALSSRRVDVSVGLDSAKFTEDIRNANRRLSSLRNGSVGLDMTGFNANMNLVNARLDVLDRRSVNPKVGLDTARFDIGLRYVNAQLSALDGRSASVSLDMNTARFQAAVLRANAQLDALGRRSVSPNVNGSGFGSFNSGAGAASGLMSALVSTAITLGPALIPLFAALTAGIGAAAVALGGATVALGVFGAAAVSQLSPVISRFSALNKAREEFRKATTQKQKDAALEHQRIALEGLNPLQREAVMSLLKLKDAWNNFGKSAQGDIFKAFNSGIRGIINLLKVFEPVVKAMAVVVAGLAARFEKFTKSGGMKDFATWLATSGTAAFLSITNSMIRFGKGIANVFSAMSGATGSGKSFTDWLEKGSKSFEKWSKSKAVIDFFNYVKQNGPVVANFLKGLWEAIKSIVLALAPVGGVVLAAFGPFLGVLAKIVRKFPELVWGIIAAAVAVRVLIPAVLGLGAALKFAAANPLVAIIAAIVIGLILLYRHSATARNIMNTMWNGIKTAAIAAWNMIQPVLNNLKDYWNNTIKPALMNFYTSTWLPIWNNIKTAASTAWTWIKSHSEQAKEVLRGVFAFLKTAGELTAAAWKLLFNVAKLVWTGIILAVTAAWPAIKAVLTQLWNFLSVVLPPAFKFIAGVVMIAMKIIIGVFNILSAIITNVVAPVIRWLAYNIIAPAFKVIAAVVNFIGPIIINIFKAIIAAIKIVGGWMMWLGKLIYSVWMGISAAVTKAWSGNTLKTDFLAIIAALKVVGTWMMWLWKNVVVVAWNAISSAITASKGKIAAIFNAIKTVIKALGTVFNWLWHNVIVPAWAGIVSAISSNHGKIVAIFNSIKIVIKALGTIFSWLWKNVVVPAWNGIHAIISSTWGKIKNIWNLIVAAAKVLGDWISKLWKNVIVPAWNGIHAIISSNWGKIKTIWNLIVAAAKTLGDGITKLWKNVIVPAWNGIYAIISSNWNKIKTIWELIKAGIKLIQDAFNRMKSVISTVWDSVKKTISDVWTNIHKTFDQMVKFVKTDIPNAFKAAVATIGKVWSGIKKLAAEPVNFITQTVYGGIHDFVGTVLSKGFGVKTNPLPGRPAKINFADGGVFAKGGVLPGYSPGRDNMVATSSRGPVHLSGGEAIMRPEWTRAVGADNVHKMNAMARRGGVSGLKRSMNADGFSTGGVFSGGSYASGGVFPGGSFDDGGIFSSIGNVVSKVASPAINAAKAAKDAVSGGIKFVKDKVLAGNVSLLMAPFKKSINAVLSKFDSMGAIGQIAGGTGHQILNGLEAWLIAKTAPTAGGDGGDVTYANASERLTKALAWARTQSGKAYQWGGGGNPSWDCSGFMAGIQRVIQGQSPGRLYTTHDFVGNSAPAGWVRGLSSPFEVGVTSSGVGHMAGTLLGVHVESAGGGKGVNVGPAARGAHDGLFGGRTYGYKPVAKEATPSGGGGGGGDDKKVAGGAGAAAGVGTGVNWFKGIVAKTKSINKTAAGGSGSGAGAVGAPGGAGSCVFTVFGGPPEVQNTASGVSSAAPGVLSTNNYPLHTVMDVWGPKGGARGTCLDYGPAAFVQQRWGNKQVIDVGPDMSQKIFGSYPGPGVFPNGKFKVISMGSGKTWRQLRPAGFARGGVFEDHGGMYREASASDGGVIKGYANGGVIPPNKPAIVGERGPELFLPGTGGLVIPNGTDLSPKLALQLSSLGQFGSLSPDYGRLTDIKGRVDGLTGGLGFTSSSGDLLKLIKTYQAAKLKGPLEAVAKAKVKLAEINAAIASHSAVLKSKHPVDTAHKALESVKSAIRLHRSKASINGTLKSTAYLAQQKKDAADLQLAQENVKRSHYGPKSAMTSDLNARDRRNLLRAQKAVTTAKTHLGARDIFAKFIPTLTDISGTTQHEGMPAHKSLTGLATAFKTAAKDKLFRTTQANLLVDKYLNPAISAAKTDGLHALGQSMYFDSMAVDGDKKFQTIRKDAKKRAAPPSMKGAGFENDYLKAFLDIRKKSISKSDPGYDRITSMEQALLSSGNYNLDNPTPTTLAKSKDKNYTNYVLANGKVSPTLSKAGLTRAEIKKSDLGNKTKKEIAQQLVSSAENSSLNWRKQYSYIEDIKDGRGYTGGIVGFTSGTHDMLELVQQYTKMKKSNPLAKFIPALKKVDGTESHKGLGAPFVTAWKEAAKDKIFQSAQNGERDRVYFDPAVHRGLGDKLRALGQFMYYDAAVVHGFDNDRDSFPNIRKNAMKKAKTPAQGGGEKTYLTSFLNARTVAMKHEEAHSDISRVTAQRKFLAEGKYDLQGPLNWKMYGDSFHLKGYAKGGLMAPNEVGVVGEKGPELFFAGRHGGQIVSNDSATAGKNQQVHISSGSSGSEIILNFNGTVFVKNAAEFENMVVTALTEAKRKGKMR